MPDRPPPHLLVPETVPNNTSNKITTTCLTPPIPDNADHMITTIPNEGTQVWVNTSLQKDVYNISDITTDEACDNGSCAEAIKMLRKSLVHGEATFYYEAQIPLLRILQGLRTAATISRITALNPKSKDND